MNNYSRRGFLKAGAAVSAGLISAPALATVNKQTESIFAHGVASGDPLVDSVMIWTRVNGDKFANQPVQVSWQVAEDEQFSRVVQSGAVTTDKNRDFTVKVDVKNLRCGSRYYYRFRSQGVYSEIGRSKTLPTGHVKQLNVAIVSCSNFPFGYFNAYQHIAADDSVDIVLHLGDYIYEYGQDGWGAENGKLLERNHLPAHEIISLSDYRQRHAQYKADPASRRMHAAHPIIPTWDDHESTNNPYMHGAQNHDPSEGDWPSRREASVRAYYEWMPIREPKKGMRREQLWRSYTFGDLASLTTLETRHTGRSKQIEYSDHLAKLKTKADRDAFMQKVLGDDSRSMLSSNMTDFVAESLAESKQRKLPWRLIGNQIPLARTHVPNLKNKMQRKAPEGYDPVAEDHKQFIQLGELDLPLYLDTWDGYQSARESFYDLCSKAGVQDLLVLTGDSHSFWANQLFTANGQRMGIEIGTAGVTSPGDFERYGPQGAALFDQLLADHNQEVLWTDCRHRGYVKLSLTHDSAKAEYMAVNTVISPKSTVKSIKTYHITHLDKSVAFMS